MGTDKLDNRERDGERPLKEGLRLRVLHARDRLEPRDHARMSARVVSQLLENAAVGQARTILSYQPLGSEVDIAAFNEWAWERGKTLAFPRCRTGLAGIMDATVPKDKDALVPGSYGIMEPDPKRSCVISPETIDVILVPCAGFDERGYRLGMGGGFYDRYLPTCTNALKIGIAFSIQKLMGDFADPWDIPLDTFLTD
jgi:5-formyltetrahydrofolate cyclo-ligase